jgi:hypothetical protein
MLCCNTGIMRILQLRISRGILWFPVMCEISGVGRNIASEDKCIKGSIELDEVVKDFFDNTLSPV